MSGMNTELDYINFLSMPKLLTRMIGLPVEATTTWQPGRRRKPPRWPPCPAIRARAASA